MNKTITRCWSMRPCVHLKANCRVLIAYNNLKSKQSFSTDHAPKIYTTNEDLFNDVVNNILYEDDNYLAINKPYGIPVGYQQNAKDTTDRPYLFGILPMLREEFSSPSLSLKDLLPWDHSGIVLLTKTHWSERIPISSYLTLTLGAPKESKAQGSFYLVNCKVNGQPQYIGCQMRERLKQFLEENMPEDSPKIQSFVLTRLKTLASKDLGEGTVVTLSQMDARTYFKYAVEWYLTVQESPVLGDTLYSQRLKARTANEDIGLMVNVQPSKKQDIPEKVLDILQLDNRPDDKVPKFVHRTKMSVPLLNGKSKTIYADLPPYFSHALQQLDIEYKNKTKKILKFSWK